jgi:outer membrane protein TolC
MRIEPGHWRTPGALAAAIALAGCTTLDPQAAVQPLQQQAQARYGAELQVSRSDADQARIAERVEALLRTPLSADSAVQIALLNHRGLQARLQGLDIADAERVQATRLRNPGFSWGRSTQGDEREIERGLHLDIARLIALPWLAPMAQRQFEQAQAGVMQQMLAVAADTRRAFVQAVAAEETVRYTEQVMQAAEASAELARRMAAVGNFNALNQAREQAFYAEATLNLARAQQARTASRERLTRQLGLWGTQTGFTLPPRLPDLPPEPADQPDIERTAMAQRLDVQAARATAEQTAKNLGLTQATRFVNVLELGVMRNGSNEAPTQRGWEIGFELPLFDSGSARIAKAEATYRQALHQAADVAINARSEVREAYAAYRTAWDIARHHRDEIVPLRQRIQQENLLRYNGMLIGVFELLADTRAQIASVNAAIEGLRDFWLAQAALDQALIGPAGAAPSALTAGPAGPSAAADKGH